MSNRKLPTIVYFDEADAARAKYQGTPTTYDTHI